MQIKLIWRTMNELIQSAPCGDLGGVAARQLAACRSVPVTGRSAQSAPGSDSTRRSEWSRSSPRRASTRRHDVVKRHDVKQSCNYLCVDQIATCTYEDFNAASCRYWATSALRVRVFCQPAEAKFCPDLVTICSGF